MEEFEASEMATATGSEDSARIRTLTEKGEGVYISQRDRYCQDIEYLWNILDPLLQEGNSPPDSIHAGLKLEQQITQANIRYQRLANDYNTFLRSTRTQHSTNDLEASLRMCEIRQKSIDVALEQLRRATQISTQEGANYVRDQDSIASSRSAVSSTSSIARRKRAKAEAAKAALVFSQQQAEMNHQKALMRQEAIRKKAHMKAQLEVDAAEESIRLTRFDNEMTILASKKEIAMLEAEARILEEEEGHDSDHRPPTIVEQSQQRVKEYVEQHSIGNYPPISSKPKSELKVEQTTDTVAPQPHKTVTHPTLNIFAPEFMQPSTTSTNFVPSGTNHTPHVGLNLGENASAQTLQQSTPIETPRTNTRIEETVSTSAITKFLLRKDLLLSRLTTFNDSAETYHVWKATFVSVANELELSDPEQLDFLVKWLGPASSKQALSIRASNANNPSRGLQRLWQRLDNEYGAPEVIESVLRAKLERFPKLTNKDNKQLLELSDILSEIGSIKEQPKLQKPLSYLDSSIGIRPIVHKLPFGLQDKWMFKVENYNSTHNTLYPPFDVFSEFVRNISLMKNNPMHAPESDSKGTASRTVGSSKFKVKVNKTEVPPTTPMIKDKSDICILHKTKHPLNDCRGFRGKSLEERKKLLKEHNVCFKCCASNTHMSKNCNADISCKECGSDRHCTALHLERSKGSTSMPDRKYGGESEGETSQSTVNTVNASCTEVCREYGGKSCAKILPVYIYHKDRPESTHKVYAIIDDQSNRSLAAPELFSLFNLHSPPESYTLSTCSGRMETSGRRAKDFIVSTFIGSNHRLELPVLIECDNIPNNREEIPTPEVAKNFAHLKDISKYLSPLDNNCNIMLLIGRDLPEAHHILDQRTGPPKAPYAHQLRLGWVVVGETCLDKQHAPRQINVKKTFILPSGQPSLLRPCENKFLVQERSLSSFTLHGTQKDQFGSTVFEKSKDDDKPGMSQEDRMFMEQMNDEFKLDSSGHWTAPLPFKTSRPSLPNNESQAWHRAQLLDASLRKNPTKREHFLEFMAKILNNHHAEVAPPLSKNEECWYLPLFGVYHPKKPNQIRGVFDSSAKYQGVSLNDVMLTGPDLANNLTGVLLRFRREMVAVTADVQHMFHCFIVREDHRNFLRFYWYEGNDIGKKLIEYRMRVHVFGNSPSPAIATLGIRKAALKAKPKYGSHVESFVTRDFYVDDGLTSCPTPKEAIQLMKDTQDALKNCGNLRLHKIASNSPEVMSAFPATDLASNLKDLDLHSDAKPLQRSLGLIWDVNADQFLFELSSDQKPVTRRGILSTINSIYDPLGFLSPVIIYGKLLLRDIVSETVDWDQPVSDDTAFKWETWKNSLDSLKDLRIPRPYVPQLSNCTSKELHVFSDASEKAIAAVVFLRTRDEQNNIHVGFVLGKAKVAPQSGTTIPRKELCGAVLAIELAQFAIEQLDIQIDRVKYYTDSKVVLGYISNSTRRFYLYVSNRVERILKFSNASQWNYVPTDKNPSDCATRSIHPAELQTSSWLNGPEQLLNFTSPDTNSYDLVMPDEDCEVRVATTMVDSFTKTTPGLGSARFERFSTWKGLTAGINLLRQVVRRHRNPELEISTENQASEDLILRTVQEEYFVKDIDNLKMDKQVSRNSSLIRLNPIWDTHRNILRVGGRLGNSSEELDIIKPIVVPGNSHIATLLVRHYHEKVKHQGRHITEGAIRSAGYWITSGKRLISSIIYNCVTCRKLRRQTQHQIMADLPTDRIEPGPPFTNVGVDVFGPWSVLTRKTRGGSANSKRWAVMFTCLVTRAVHIEIIEEMTSSSFINALRRFTAIRGPVKLYRSDQGTNFVGAVDDLQFNHGPIQRHLRETNTEWKFNPPHASHMGGAWERMIGTARRILDAMLAEAPSRKFLTHEVLSTFMAEVCAIINSRPLVPVSTDPDNPLILTPAMLLTQKINYTYRSDELGDMSQTDLYRSQWKRVQALSQTFWSRWRKEYLPSLQVRRKWTTLERNLREGDVVLLRDNSLCRNRWPLGIVTRVVKGSDDHVRKAEVRTIIGEKCEAKVYSRPITEIVLLLD